MQKINFLLYICGLLTILWSQIGFTKGIVGGHIAKAGQFKYHVLVLANKRPICGGTIIDDLHVLTAAHCVLTENTKFMNMEFSIIAGIATYEPKKSDKLEVKVKKIFVPKECKFLDANVPSGPQCEVGDIAVLKLCKGLKLDKNTNLKAVKLPKATGTYVSYETEEAIVSGFGSDSVMEKTQESLETQNYFSTNLKYLPTQVISNNRCASMYYNSIESSHICAQMKKLDDINDDVQGGVCTGDSGGPLVLKDGTLIGILNNGPADCDEIKHAGVYSRITYYLAFIEKATKDEDSPVIRVATYETTKGICCCKEKNLVEIIFA